MNSKKILAGLSAAVLSVTLLPLSAFAEDTAASSDSLTLPECIDRVNEMNRIDELNAPDVGIYATPISDEDGEIIQRVLENDYANADDTEYVYKYQKYDFSSDYYYNQLPSHLQKAYLQLDEACSEFLTSSVDLSTQVFQRVTFDSPMASVDELRQLYYSFYYSNPQYFFLANGFGYASDYSYINLKTYDNCQTASVKSTIKNSIDSLTDSYINSVSSLSADYEKETAIAKKISDLVDYDLSASYNQSMMSALYYNKSVCNGYAMSMNYFCNALGYECITVTSSNHAWNRVLLNGKWYEADVTWYDQTDTSTVYWEKWLNKSTATFLANDSQSAHVVNTSHSMYTNVTLPSCTDDDPSDNEAVASLDKPVFKVASGNGSISISWDAVPNATEYTITFAPKGGVSQTVTVTNTKYSIVGLTNGTTYSVLVRAKSGTVLSPYTSSDYIEVTPMAPIPANPVISSLTPSEDSVTVKWNSVSNAEGYYVCYRVSGTTSWSEVDTTATTKIISGLASGTQYDFLVRAYNDSGISSYTDSDIKSISTNIAVPENPVISSLTPGENSVTVEWDPVSDADGYYVCYRKSGTTAWYRIEASSSPQTISNLTGGTEYEFLVRAYNDAGTSSYTDSDIKTETPAVPIPKNPVISSLTPGENSVTVKWSTVSGADGYYVCYRISGTDIWNRIEDASTPQVVSDLIGGTQYDFVVCAYNDSGTSSYTDSYIKTATPAVSVPENPVISSLIPGENSVTVEWEPVSGADSYSVYYRVSGTTMWTIINADSTSQIVSDLKGGTEYEFLVRAYNDSGASSYTDNDIKKATPAVPDAVEINTTTFPDATFRQYVSDNFDTDNSGGLSQEELDAVTEINVSGTYETPNSIASLTGIEYFTKLKTLYCTFNKLTSLDVSKNTALTVLYCNDNQLTSLNVSKNTALKELKCHDNQLTSLNVSNNTALTGLGCFNNKLTSLNVSKNTALTELYCNFNMITSLNVSNNTALIYLNCSSNLLTSLDVSKNTALTYLNCSLNQLTALNVSKNTALKDLSCHYNRITTLDVSKNTALTELLCANNQLTTLDVNKNTLLFSLSCNNNQLTTLDVSKNTALLLLHCSDNQLTSLDLSKNTSFGDLDSVDNTYSIGNVIGSYSLDNLPAGFDSSKASNWTGADYDAATNSLKNFTSTTVTYDYDCGYGDPVTFTLTASSYTAPVPEKTVPTLNVTVVSGEVELTWDAIDGASMYWLYVFGSNGLVTETPVFGTNATVTGLTPGQSYGFVAISYINGAWDFNWTIDDLAYAFIPPERTVPVLNVTPVSGGANVSWDAVPGAGMYWLYVFGSDGLVDEMPVFGTSQTVTGLTPGQGYAFVAISYINGAWDFSWTAEDLVYTFVAPERTVPVLNVTPISGGANVSWEAVPGAYMYWLYVFGDNGLVTETPVFGTSTTITGLTSGKGYAFVGISYINGAWDFNWTANDLVYTIAG